MKRIIIFLVLLAIIIPAIGQRRARRMLKKEQFIHTWTLYQIRNRMNEVITNKVEKKVLRFTADSVFIQTADKFHRGKWVFEKGQIQIDIPGCPECNYKWTVIEGNIICFRIGEDMLRLECFKQKD